MTKELTGNKSHINGMVYFVAIIAATGGLLFGFDTGVISGALLFIKQQWGLSSFAQGCIVSSVLIGAVVGAFCSGKITDKFGRKAVIITTAIIFLAGSIACTLAPDPKMLMIFRFFLGIAIGIASYAVPLYISEISPDQIRGALVSLNQLAITVGILSSYFVDNYFAAFDNGWRYMMLVGCIPALILGAGMSILPDTPRWLVSKKRSNEAKIVLEKLDSDKNSTETLYEIEKSMNNEAEGNFNDLLQPWLRPALIVGIGLMFFQQFTGINTVIYYAPTIFQMSGFESASAAITATVGVGIINVLMTVVSIWLIDRIGRKQLLSIGLLGMTLSLGVLGAVFNFSISASPELKWLTVASLFLYVASFAISLGPVCWLIISEIYPTKIRGLAMSIATLSNWVFNLIVALTFLPMIDFIGKASAFWTFAVVSILGWFFCYFLVPETKGLSLEEIQKNLTGLSKNISLEKENV